MELKRLKSGTDVRGVADTDLTDEVVSAIAMAFAVVLKREKADVRIAVGHDSRLSGERITETVINALRPAGCEIYDCGLTSTPSMFMMTQFEETKCDGAIMVTASHHPSDKNGLKFFTKAGGIGSEQLDEILTLAEQGARSGGNYAKIVHKDFLSLYCDFLIDKVIEATGDGLPFAGLKIAVDAGNGAGGFFADRVLEPLGADITCSQFLNPDGRFPNHIPNPENEDAMRSIRRRVLDTKADLGIIFDTDVDRSAIVSSDGEEINRNALIALISAVLLEEQPGATIVTDSVTSDGLAAFIRDRGGVHHRFKRGYRNVIDEAIRLEKSGINAPLAIETSGHAAFKENYFLDDGAYLAVRLLIKMAQLRKKGKSLTSLIEDLKKPLEAKEVRLRFSCDDFADYGGYIISELGKVCEELAPSGVCRPADDNREGIRVTVPAEQGWFLARMSVHDPIMVVNFESDKIGGTNGLAAFLHAYMSQYSAVDSTPLQALAAQAQR